MNSTKNLKDRFDIDKMIAFVKKHARYFVAGALFILLLVVLAVFTGGKDEMETGAVPNTEVTEASQETVIQSIASEEMQENAVPAVSELIQNYYTAYAAGDVNTLLTIAKPISVNEQGYIGLYSQYVESYQNMIYYTKSGLDDNSYLVNVYVEVKFEGVDTLAPGLDFFYIRSNEDGSLYIDNLYSQFNLRNNENALDTSVQNLIAHYVSGEDVATLLQDVKLKYETAIAADANLADMVSKTIPNAIAQWSASLVPPAPETPETETPETETPETEVPETETPETEEPEVPEVTTETVMATTKVNVRAKADASSEKLGSVTRGTTLTRTGTEGEWSIVEYNGTTGYIMSEYLTTDVSSEEGAAAADGIPEGTVVTLENTTNIRSKMDASSDRVGVAYAGDKVTVVMSYAEGWTKVTWDGETGYIRTDLLQ